MEEVCLCLSYIKMYQGCFIFVGMFLHLAHITRD